MEQRKGGAGEKKHVAEHNAAATYTQAPTSISARMSGMGCEIVTAMQCQAGSSGWRVHTDMTCSNLHTLPCLPALFLPSLPPLIPPPPPPPLPPTPIPSPPPVLGLKAGPSAKSGQALATEAIGRSSAWSGERPRVACPSLPVLRCGFLNSSAAVTHGGLSACSVRRMCGIHIVDG